MCCDFVICARPAPSSNTKANMEPITGLEPVTSSLPRKCSTD
jgi:hypothetical protein